jgi:hypothetical protein
MGKISDAFQDAMAAQAKAALTDVVTKNPGTTVKDLRKLISMAPELGSMTLGELLGAGGSTKTSAPRRAAKRSTAAKKGGRKRAPSIVKRDVRRQSGRDALDADVLAALEQCGGDTVAARQVREILHTDPTQLRASLNRLIAAGKVTFTGKARGTRYSLV